MAMDVSAASMAAQVLDARRQLEGLEMAARIVEKDLQMDGAFPHLFDQLKVAQNGPVDVSGHHDNDYPSLSSVAPGLELLPQMAEVKTIPLPNELVEQFAHMQCNCTMGLFTEVGRAWLAIDSNVFVWIYENGGDLAYFDGLSETILGAALVKPKAGIFQRHIKYLLCLTTPIEVVLLGISFSKSFDDVSSDLSTSEMHLIPEPLFLLPSDNTYMPTIVGSDLGRIFLGGKDGCLYEIVYQAEEGWFSRKCNKINHSQSRLSFLVPSFLSSAFIEEDAIVQIAIDNSRNILYTRSGKGNISVYDLGADGQSITRVTSLSQAAIMQEAITVARNIDRTNFSRIIHISAVEALESAKIHLIIVTQAGVRLYFTAINLSNPQGSRPVTLRLVHVRLPPGFSAVSPPIRPNNVHLVHCRRGTFLMATSQSEDSDILWCLNNDSFSFQSKLMEAQTTLQVDGKTWAMAEIPRYVHVAVAPVVHPPIVVTQHQEPQQKFILISAQGCHIITKLRPVDQLRQLLLNNNGPESEAVQAFFRLHRVDQACAMCLILICSAQSTDNQVVESALRAFFLYGGEPQISLQSINPYAGSGPSTQVWGRPSVTSLKTDNQAFRSINNAGFNPSQVSTPLPTGYPGASSFYTATSEFSPATPILSQSGLEPTGGIAAYPEIQYSGRHNGLYLLFSRIVRPFWDERLVLNITCQSKEGASFFLASSIKSKEINFYLEQLTGLRQFLSSHQSNNLPFNSENSTQTLSNRFGSIFGTGETPVISQHQQLQTQRNMTDYGHSHVCYGHSHNHAEAQLKEKVSIYNLQQLVERTAEVIGLWRVLYDHQFHIVSSSLHKDYQNQLRSMAFKDLIISGQQLASVLISNLINRYLGDYATTDALSSCLREVCPSIYRVEDATFSKANELLIQAQKETNAHTRQNLLQESLHLCKRIVPKVNMAILCNHLQVLQCYEGIIDLCLLSASRLDPQNIALHYYLNGERKEDQQGFQAFIARMDCYKHIVDTLVLLSQAISVTPNLASVPKTSGPPTSSSELGSMNPEYARQTYEHVLTLSLSSDDEMAHVAIFNWLVDNTQADKLLELKSPYVEAYLKRSASCYSDNLSKLDLLWKYYEKNGQYGAAAKILSMLADRHSTNMSLQQRIEYLSRAAVCMKSVEVLPGSRTEGEFLHDLEEKMEVARIQNQILDALSNSRMTGIEEAIARLNADLLDITHLYEEFAYPFHFHECQLAVIHCAGYNDPTLVETLWQNIIDKELGQLGINTDASVQALCKKLKSLGKLYVSSQDYFPLPFLIKYLELKNSEMNLDCKWPYKTLFELGVPLPKLLELYNRFYKSKDPQWLTPKRSFHILKVLSQIVALFADCLNTVEHQERRQCIGFFLDAITSYLVDLQTLDITDPTVKGIMESFQSTQIRLKRVL